MESTIVKIFRDHDPNRFPNDTDGAAGRCSAHGEAGACGGVGNHDVLLEEKDGTPGALGGVPGNQYFPLRLPSALWRTARVIRTLSAL